MTKINLGLDKAMNSWKKVGKDKTHNIQYQNNKLGESISIDNEKEFGGEYFLTIWKWRKNYKVLTEKKFSSRIKAFKFAKSYTRKH